MRILTVRQPWAWAIIHAGKTVENRSRNIAGDYRGPVLIHVALRDDDEWDERDAHAFIGVCPFQDAPVHNRHGCTWCREVAPLTWKQQGNIIGVVDLVDVHLCSGECSPWAEGPVDLGRGIRDIWHMVFENPRALDEPIPHKGALGLRKTDFDVIGDTLAAPWGHLNRSCTPYGCEPGCELEPVAKLIAADITRMEQGT